MSEKLCEFNNYPWYGIVSFIDCTLGGSLGTFVETVNNFLHEYIPVQQIVKRGPFMQEESNFILISHILPCSVRT